MFLRETYNSPLLNKVGRLEAPDINIYYYETAIKTMSYGLDRDDNETQ